MHGTQRQVLNDVSGMAGVVEAGSNDPGMFAILGPSGAGKTTLLNILAGRLVGKGVRGQVRL